MYSTLLSVALFSALAIQGALADFTVETPSTIAQCEAVHLTWDSTGSKSYNVAIVNSSDPCDDVLADLGDHTVNHITWTPTLKVGDEVMISVLSDDDEGWSGSVKVTAGNDTSCLPDSSSSASASATKASSSASASGTTLVVNPEAAATAATSAPAAPSSSDSAQAVGAANSGVLGNGAFSSVQFSASSLVLSAAVAFAALAL